MGKNTTTDLNGTTYDSSTVVDLQYILEQLVLLRLILIILPCLQVDGLSHSATEIHHSISGVSPLQGLIAASEPGDTGCGRITSSEVCKTFENEFKSRVYQDS